VDDPESADVDGMRERRAARSGPWGVRVPAGAPGRIAVPIKFAGEIALAAARLGQCLFEVVEEVSKSMEGAAADRADAAYGHGYGAADLCVSGLGGVELQLDETSFPVGQSGDGLMQPQCGVTGGDSVGNVRGGLGRGVGV
jgi:hypothetical protein